MGRRNPRRIPAPPFSDQRLLLRGIAQLEPGHVVLDQIRTVDRGRLIRRLGRLSPQALEKSITLLGEMFAP